MQGNAAIHSESSSWWRCRGTWPSSDNNCRPSGSSGGSGECVATTYRISSGSTNTAATGEHIAVISDRSTLDTKHRATIAERNGGGGGVKKLRKIVATGA